MKRILVAIDWSAASLRAAKLASELAGKYGAELLLLTVMPHLPPSNPGIAAFERSEHMRESPSALVLSGTEEALVGIGTGAKAQGVPNFSCDVRIGDPAQEILAWATDAKADLVILGTRGHGRLAGLLMGSVAQKVLSLAGCSVLVVR